jgi:GNAT superfamily N-acetyltransferase
MFASTDLARRIEAAEAAASAGMARAIIARGVVPGAFAQPAAGGMAVFTGVDAPLTKVIGAGFGTLPDADTLDGIEERFFAQGAEVRYEIASLADPELLRTLTARGFELHGFENVLGLALPAGTSEAGTPIDVVPADDPVAWRNTLIDGFSVPDEGVPSAPGESFPREALERAFQDLATDRAFTMFLARIDGSTAGAAGLRVIHGVAQLCGAATLPGFRRRGVQSTLLRERLTWAAGHGSDLAVVTTQPGSRSQHNAQRAGFALLYTRAVLIRRPPGAGA